MELVLLTLVMAIVIGCMISEKKGLVYGFILWGAFWSLVLAGYIMHWIGL